jgi:HK97 family phage prohead protease
MQKQFFRAYRATEQPESGPLRFVAATEAIARDGLVIDSAGWQLDNYRSNPVVLWAHDYSGQRPPIGRAEIGLDGGNLMADITFDQGDPFAADVERKYRNGFLNAVSVGWNTIEMAPSGDGRSVGTVTKAELLDISAVPVPGDPGALLERQARGLADLGLVLAKLTDEPNESEAVPLAGEVDWAGTALLMARLYLDSAEDPDEERKRTWVRLARRYERMGKQPPEFLPRADLSVLGEAEIRGLFLSGEADVLGPFLAGPGERAGAVLSQRNKGDLEQAVTLIKSVLDRASIVSANGEEPADDQPQRLENERMKRYVAALEELRTQLGGN